MLDDGAEVGALDNCCTGTPTNLAHLAQGRHLVLVAISTDNPTQVHALEADAVSFQVVDRSAGDGVRGEYANHYPGVVRPMLDWKVGCASDSREADV